MITPAGSECRYFYGDYYRGRNHEECRLLAQADLRWQAYMCAKCPIPEIIQANACEHLRFHPRLEKPLLIGKAQVKISATCEKCDCAVDEPRIGCGQCHPLLDVFMVDPNDSDSIN